MVLLPYWRVCVVFAPRPPVPADSSTCPASVREDDEASPESSSFSLSSSCLPPDGASSLAARRLTGLDFLLTSSRPDRKPILKINGP